MHSALCNQGMVCAQYSVAREMIELKFICCWRVLVLEMADASWIPKGYITNQRFIISFILLTGSEPLKVGVSIPTAGG